MHIVNTGKLPPLAGGIGSLVSAFGGHRIRFAPDDGSGTGEAAPAATAQQIPDDGGELSLSDYLERRNAAPAAGERTDDGGAPGDETSAEDAEHSPDNGDGDHAEDGQDEPGAEEPPAIEPPATLSAELRAKWSSFDPETQQHLAQWETGRQEGVQAKLRETAEARKAIDADRKAVDAERQQAAQFRHVLDMAVAELGSQLQQEPDWSALAADDPIGYIQQRANWDAKVQRFQQLHAEQQRQAAQQQAEQTERLRAYVADQRAKALELIPEWKDPAKAKAEHGEIRTWLEKAGFSSKEITELHDARLAATIRKAWLYDKARTGLNAKPAATAAKPVGPGAATSRQDARSTDIARLTARLNETGDLRDYLALQAMKTKSARRT